MNHEPAQSYGGFVWFRKGVGNAPESSQLDDALIDHMLKRPNSGRPYDTREEALTALREAIEATAHAIIA